MVAGDEWKMRVAMGGPMGVITGTFQAHQRLIDNLNTRAAMQNASISKGGLTVKDGGKITVLGENGERITIGEAKIHIQRGDLPPSVIDAGDWSLARPGLRLNDGVGGYVSMFEDTDGRSQLRLGAKYLTRIYSDQIELWPFSEAGGGHGSMQFGPAGFVLDTASNPIDLNAGAAEALVRGSIVRLRGSGAQGVKLEAPSGDMNLSSGFGITLSTTGYLTLSSTAGVRLTAAGSTGATANCYISGSGQNAQLYQVSSSIRYKQDVEDHHVDQDALLSAVPRSWRDRSEVAADPDTTSRYVGFIAEEIDELGLSEFVVYNPDGTPESVAYDRLTVGLLDVVKTQQQQIAWLTERVAQLSGETMPDFRPDPTRGVRATRPVPPSPIVEEEVP